MRQVRYNEHYWWEKNKLGWFHGMAAVAAERSDGSRVPGVVVEDGGGRLLVLDYQCIEFVWPYQPPNVPPPRRGFWSRLLRKP